MLGEKEENPLQNYSTEGEVLIKKNLTNYDSYSTIILGISSFK
jgi:hypothetical protein